MALARWKLQSPFNNGVVGHRIFGCPNRNKYHGIAIGRRCKPRVLLWYSDIIGTEGGGRRAHACSDHADNRQIASAVFARLLSQSTKLFGEEP